MFTSSSSEDPKDQKKVEGPKEIAKVVDKQSRRKTETVSEEVQLISSFVAEETVEDLEKTMEDASTSMPPTKSFYTNKALSKITSNPSVLKALAKPRGGCLRKVVYCLHLGKYSYVNKNNRQVSGVSFTLMDVDVNVEPDGKGYYIQKYYISTGQPEKFYDQFPVSDMPTLLVVDLRLPDRPGGNVTLVSYRKISKIVTQLP